MLKKTLAGSCLIAVAQLVFATSPAYAGFQWMAQPEQAPAAQQAASPGYATVAPAATSAPEIVSPVVISGSATDQSSYVLSSAPAQPAPARPAKEATDLSSATLTIPASTANETVRGFGTQIPLALALRQILPVGYNFSIDQNIEVDTPVSYKGGKSWRETIKDMLAPAGMSMREQGAAVTVSRAEPAPTPAPMAANEAPALQPISSAMPPKPTVPQTLGTLSSSYVSDMPGVNVGSGSGWSAQRGDSLHKVLTEWCRRAGVELQWRSEYDYPMEASASFSGDFEIGRAHV
jgi:hypothetical protein